MLSKELLQQQESLSSLSEEQINAIVTLSTNDENQTIAKKVGEIYAGLDADILAATGVAKNGSEKTYDYAKRVMGDLRGKVDNIPTLEGKIATLKADKAKLEKAIADGSQNDELTKQLTKTKTDLANVTNQYNELNERFGAAEKAHQAELVNLRVDGLLSAAEKALKFKPQYTEQVIKMAVTQAQAKLRGMAQVIDGSVVYVDEKGATLLNNANAMQPYTTDELLRKELEAFGILDEEKRTGTETKNVKVEPTNYDLSGARTKMEAHDIITKQLARNGLLKGTKEYQREFDKLWADVQHLPLQ